MSPPDYYKLLDIPLTASPEEIRKAYRRQAFRYHPDHNKSGLGGEERFRQIKEAYQVLGDPLQKRYYDIQRRQLKHVYAPSYSWGKHTTPAREDIPPTPLPEEEQPPAGAMRHALLKLLVLGLCALLLIWLITAGPAWIKAWLAR